MKKIGIVVPCYNEEASLGMFYEELNKKIHSNKYIFNIIFIDDGSKDKTLEIMREFSKVDKRVNYISFSRNFGKEAAMQAGLEKAKEMDAVIMIDADLQHPPAMILEMIALWENGNKIVYTRNVSRKGEPRVRSFFAKRFYSSFDKYSDNIKMEQGVKDFQLLDKRVVDAFLKMPDNNRFVKGIFSWVGFKKECIPLKYIERVAGKTTWNFRKLLIYGIDGLNQFSSVLKLLPKLAFLFVLVIMIVEEVMYCFEIITLSELIMNIKIDVYMLIILILIYFIFHLLYNIRSETIKRPIYLVEEESYNETN